MSKRFDRTIALIGEENVERIKRAHVLVVGIGGVGGAAVETLVRCGVGELTLVDGDVFEESNLNRQLFATESTLGKNKAEASAARAKEIDRNVKATAIQKFLTAQNVCEILRPRYDYCIDAIDDAAAKVELIVGCKAAGIPIVSAMGAGNRLDCDFAVTDLFKTAYDPFARVMRGLLKGRIDKLDTVCASTPPLLKRGTPASIAAPPIVMGALLANHVVRQLIGL